MRNSLNLGHTQDQRNFKVSSEKHVIISARTGQGTVLSSKQIMCVIMMQQATSVRAQCTQVSI